MKFERFANGNLDEDEDGDGERERKGNAPMKK